MPGEYDEKFDELTSLVRRVGGRVVELQLDVRDMRQDLGKVREETAATTVRLGSLEKKFDVLSGQFNGIGSMAIDDHKRIDALEKRVDDLEGATH
jgi:outer membrane murein-binding lipoprotein Lpp